MSLLDWLRGRSPDDGGAPVERALTPDQVAQLSGGVSSRAGVNVNEDTALTHAAVWACVRAIAETMASLPLKVYRRTPDGGKVEAPEHPLFPLLHDEPCPTMASFTFRESMQAAVLMHGNAYARVEGTPRGAGRVAALWYSHPESVKVEPAEDGRSLIYTFRRKDGDSFALPASQVLHVPGLGFDGIAGKSVLRQAREVIGLGLAADQHGAAFFGSGSMPGGVLRHPGKLSREAAERLKASWEAAHSGPGKQFSRVAVIEEGMEFQPVIFPSNDDAEWLESRRFSVEEIARLFRVPPHIIGDLTRATYSNIEHQGIEFATHCIRPWVVRWEQELNRKLLPPRERKQYVIAFSLDALLRGDIASRYSAYAIGRQWGWLSANDIRALENLNPIPDGDDYIKPGKPEAGVPDSADPPAAEENDGPDSEAETAE